MLPFLLLRRGEAPKPNNRCELVLNQGCASVYDNRMKSPDETSLVLGQPQLFPVGLTLAVDAGSKVVLRLGEDQVFRDLGEVTIEGPSQVRLDASSPELKRLFLHEGLMRARISANAKQKLFQVGTPAGNAVDLGCIYTMRVDDKTQATELRVQLGRVAFELAKETLYVWSGARCIIDPARGAGLPVDDAADPNFQRAADSWDRAADAASKSAALAALSRHARPEDAATLWHVVATTGGSLRSDAVTALRSSRPARSPSHSPPSSPATPPPSKAGARTSWVGDGWRWEHAFSVGWVGPGAQTCPR